MHLTKNFVVVSVIVASGTTIVTLHPWYFGSEEDKLPEGSEISNLHWGVGGTPS